MDKNKKMTKKAVIDYLQRFKRKLLAEGDYWETGAAYIENCILTLKGHE